MTYRRMHALGSILMGQPDTTEIWNTSFALYRLGASEDRIQIFVETHARPSKNGARQRNSNSITVDSSQIMKIGSMNVLRKYIWHLNEGCIADAFGPFIHIGFAAEVGCPIGLAHAFAALSSSYNYLGDLPAATPDKCNDRPSFYEVLRRTRSLKEIDEIEPELKKRASFDKRISMLRNLPYVMNHALNLAIGMHNGKSTDILREIVRGVTDMYISCGSRDYYLTRCFVALASVLRIVSLLDPTNVDDELIRLRLLRSYSLAVLFTFVAQGRPILPETPVRVAVNGILVQDGNLSVWNEIAARALELENSDLIMLVEACKRIYFWAREMQQEETCQATLYTAIKAVEEYGTGANWMMPGIGYNNAHFVASDL